jgi:hypothetical protein
LNKIKPRNNIKGGILMKKFKELIHYVIFLLGVLTALLVLFPALNYNEGVYTGLQIAFGTEIINVAFFNLGPIVNARLPFNFIASLAYILPLVAGILALLVKKGNIVVFTFFLVSIVFFAVLPNQIILRYSLFNTTTDVNIDWVMSYGTILGIIFTSIATSLEAYRLVKK